MAGPAHITVGEFTKIAAATGDDTPLSPQLAKAGPHWTNATVTIAMKYQDGKVYNEQVASTAKTVKGKYIVTIAESQYYHQKMTSISTFDEKASAFRTWGLFGDTVTEETTVYDFDKKIYATFSAYSDGFTELGVGSYSENAETSRTLVYKGGVLFCTRDVTVTPK
jgi:hypothetical protein